jgi:hypothetical protein
MRLSKLLTLRILSIVAVSIALYSCSNPQFSLGPSQAGTLHIDPTNARIVSSDIVNFWAAFDAGAKASDFETLYFGKASNGLKDFVRVRASSVNPTSLANVVRTKPRYFASIRPFTLQAPSVGAEVQRLFAKFKRMFPDAVFSDVYLMMGGMATGGTITNNSILIGTELFGRDASTPTEELGDWHKAVTKPISDLPVIIAHELIHIEQAHFGMNYGNTLLGKALQEGSADFVAELFTEKNINQHLKEYGNPRQKELWQEFSREMNGTDISKWLYNANASVGRPADLGYYIGYKITEAYYNKASDKQKALREIMSMKNPQEFLMQSGYNPQ